MTDTAAVYTTQTDERAAGVDIGEKVLAELGAEPADVLVVFASSDFDYSSLLEAIDETCNPELIVGASSAGEFSGANNAEGAACALAIRSPEMHFSAALARDMSRDCAEAAREIVANFEGLTRYEYPSRTALVLTDALAGHADEFIEQLTLLTSGQYQFAGGGAGDDAPFSSTHVFLGTQAYTDAAVALEILSFKAVGVGVGHGWVPSSEGHRVTESSGKRLVSLDGHPAVEAFEAHAVKKGQVFDPQAPLPFFLHNVLGIESADGHRLRVPLSVEADGTVVCAAEIPEGATVKIMETTDSSAVEAAASATRSAVDALGSEEPGAALFFDCVATRLRLGDVFGYELDAVRKTLGSAKFVGCNTYGQIARGTGQFNGFHNCTAVVFVLPK